MVTPSPLSQCGRVLAILQDGNPHAMRDIHRAAGTMRLNSRVAELRNTLRPSTDSMPHERGRKEKTMKLYRQGDILIVAIHAADLPAHAQPVKRENGKAILAHGEITGHHHAVLDRNAELVTDGELVDAAGARELYLLVRGNDPVELVHQEHATITIDPGQYKVVRQREYTPEAPRQVLD